MVLPFKQHIFVFMKTGLAIILVFFSMNAVRLFAQTNSATSLQFHHTFNTADIQLHDAVYSSKTNDSIWIDVCKYYISGIQLLQNGITVWSEKNSYHLLNTADTATMLLKLQTPADIVFDRVQFNMGIDSITSVAGAMGKDLDPTNGMYWTWQSGYINIKLEGSSNKCLTRNNAFIFHIGGYQSPFNALQKVTIPVSKKQNIHIVADLQQFFEAIDLASENQIMSPGKSAVVLSKLFSTIFSELKQ